MMDCDTTGVEPDLALVKFKKLVGGGSMQIVNQTVPRALKNLGYQPEQVEAITEYIAEHGHVVDAPGLRPEHYEVFDCAMGERAISPMGHVRMMAAVQPGLSGAISKTVNMPENAAIEDIEKIYFEGWKLGLKALAIYRDNCKVGQPLSDARKKPEKAPDKAEAPAPRHEVRPVRRRLPRQRPASVTRFSVAGAEGYMTVSKYPDDGVGEVFLKLGKQGSTLARVMDAFSMAISISLQYGVPLEKWVEKFTNMRFEPARDRRPGHPDREFGDGLRVPPSGARPPALRDAFRAEHPVGGRACRATRGGRPRRDHRRHGPGRDGSVRRARLPHPDRPAHQERAAGQEQSGRTGQPERAGQQARPTEQERSPQNGQPAAQPHSSTELLESQQGRTADAPLCLICGTKMRPPEAATSARAAVPPAAAVETEQYCT